MCPSCKSNFHFTNHLRSFNIYSIKGLFDEFGFRNEKIILGVTNMNFKYITPLKRFIKRINKKPLKHSHTVHCSVCGYIIKPNKTYIDADDFFSKNKKLNLLQKLWPKNYVYNWIFALYIKK